MPPPIPPQPPRIPAQPPRVPQPPPAQAPRPAGPRLTAAEPPAGCIRFWRGCQLLPFVYLAVAWVSEHFLFPALGVTGGFLRMAPAKFRVLLLSFVGLAAMAQMLLVILRRSANARLAALPDGDPGLASAHWHRTLTLGGCADAVAGLGLILFLLQGDWDALIGFCLGAYFLYAQAHPKRFLPSRGA